MNEDCYCRPDTPNAGEVALAAASACPERHGQAVLPTDVRVGREAPDPRLKRPSQHAAESRVSTSTRVAAVVVDQIRLRVLRGRVDPHIMRAVHVPALAGCTAPVAGFRIKSRKPPALWLSDIRGNLHQPRSSTPDTAPGAHRSQSAQLFAQEPAPSLPRASPRHYPLEEKLSRKVLVRSAMAPRQR